jgi:hypothetical protein
MSDAQPAALAPTDLLYNAFADVFGNQNPQQLFSLVWPGTILDYETYKFDAGANEPVPPLVEIAQSVLFDTFYPIAPVTQPDGTRVSDRYRQVISALAAKPNERLIDMQREIRQRLDVRTTVTINGVTQNVTVLEKFDILQERWVAAVKAWGAEKARMLQSFRDNGSSDWWERYVAWYELAASGYLADIESTYNRMLADFPINLFEDALAILDTHDAAALLRAKNELREAETRVPSSLGDRFLPAQAIPRNWGNMLKSSSDFRDLLADPFTQQRYLELCVDRLLDEINGWNAILATIPDTDKDQIAEALNEFTSSSKAYYTATSDMINTYGENAVVAAKIYIDYKEDQKEKDDNLNNLEKKLDDQNPKGKATNPIDWKKVADDVLDAQKKLNGSTNSMVASGQNLATKAAAYLNSRAGEKLKAMIAPALNKLQSQLSLLDTQVRNFATSAFRATKLTNTEVPQGTPEGKKSDPDFASTADDVFNRRWSNVTIQFTSSNMAQQSETSTSFSQTNWQVDFFFGGAGGESQTASQQFASDYMDKDSSIQIGMLATKVVIQRPWMHPELFNDLKKYFKSIESPITPAQDFTKFQLLPGSLGGSAPSSEEARKNCELVNQAILPGYPVALLLAKDITIKMTMKASQTSAMQQHMERNSSSGGGFLCFSVSHNESATDDKQSTSSYAMAGEFIFRIPAPQIIGVWNQILPRDQAASLDSDEIARIMRFKADEFQARAVTAIKAFQDVPPAKPGS